MKFWGDGSVGKSACYASIRTWDWCLKTHRNQTCLHVSVTSAWNGVGVWGQIDKILGTCWPAILASIGSFKFSGWPWLKGTRKRIIEEGTQPKLFPPYSSSGLCIHLYTHMHTCTHINIYNFWRKKNSLHHFSSKNYFQTNNSIYQIDNYSKE